MGKDMEEEKRPSWQRGGMCLPGRGCTKDRSLRHRTTAWWLEQGQRVASSEPCGTNGRAGWRSGQELEHAGPATGLNSTLNPAGGGGTHADDLF